MDEKALPGFKFWDKYFSWFTLRELKKTTTKLGNNWIIHIYFSNLNLIDIICFLCKMRINVVGAIKLFKLGISSCVDMWL